MRERTDSRPPPRFEKKERNRTMRTTFQRLGAAALVVCLMLGLCVPALAADRATAKKDGAFLRGTFTYGPHESDADLSDDFIYSDRYFSGSSYTANEHLATMSMQMAAASISSEDAGYPEKSQNVRALLSALGFENIEVNSFYQEKMQQNTMGTAAAYKELDGETVLLAIVPRSAGYEQEWGGNFNVGTGNDAVSKRYTTDAVDEQGNAFQGTDGLHAGFQLARNIALEFTRSYVANHPDVFKGKTIKVWTMGYSRGAATANLIGAALVDDAENAIGLTVDSKNVYAYTFGTPLTVCSESAEPAAEKYNGIHNYFADYDPVAMVPFAGWGFARYGQNVVYNASARKGRMLRFLQAVNRNVYRIYTDVTGKGDPDNFQGYTLGEGLTLTPSGEKISQKQFLTERINYLTSAAAENRAVYSEAYQTPLSALVGFYLGESDEIVDSFLAGAANNKNDLMLLVTMLAFYDWADQYAVSEAEGKAAQAAAKLKEILPTQTSEGYSDEARVFLASDAYKDFYAVVTDANKLAAYMLGSGAAKSDYQKQAEAAMKDVLTAGFNSAGIMDDDETRTTLLSDDSVSGLTKFLGYFVFGTNTKLSDLTDSASLRDALIEKINTAATLIGNAGTYMRVHNNEVILSWLRTMDSYYDDLVPAGSVSDDFIFAVSAALLASTKASAYEGFSDLKVNAWYRDGIEYVLKHGLMNGVSKTKFAPEGAVSRAAVVTVLWRMAGSPTAGDAISYTDVSWDAWYAEAICWATSAGIAGGYPDGRFGANDSVTREQLAAMLYRFAKVQGYDVSVGENTNILSYDDAFSVSGYAIPALQWACGAGLLQGDGAKLLPKNSTSRAQLAAILMRMAAVH